MLQWAHFALAVVSRRWANGGSEFVVLRCYFIQRINVYRDLWIFSGTRMPIHLAFDVLQKSSSLSHSCHFQILQRRAGSNYGRASRAKQFSYGDGRWAVSYIGLINRRWSKHFRNVLGFDSILFFVCGNVMFYCCLTMQARVSLFLQYA